MVYRWLRLFCLAVLLTLGARSASAWKVLMVGDSHVCSKIYPHEVERILTEEEGDIKFSFFGKIGAGFYTYNESHELMNEIYESHPDILIVHMGTNDSFSKRFDNKEFLRNLTRFYDDVEKHDPECRVVFVTPFYNHLKGSNTPNRNTRKCADAYLDFARNHHNVYIVDNNATHGMYFLDNRGEMMRHDCVHLTEKGYEMLGRQVGEALAQLEDLWIIGEPPYLGD